MCLFFIVLTDGRFIIFLSLHFLGEILALVEDRGWVRKPSSISGLLERRIEYVRQNVESMDRRLDGEMEALDLLGFGDDDLPLMEITEQLDEDGNVVSSSVVRPSDIAPALLEVLQKGGVQDEQLKGMIEDVKKMETKDLEEKDAARKDVLQDLEIKKPEPDNLTEDNSTHLTTTAPLKKKKSVSFAAEPQINHIPRIAEEFVPRKARFAKNVDIIHQEPMVDPVIPENESTEDILLRREMLEYNMRDVSKIVAEININDQDSSDEDEYEDEDEDGEEDEDEDEDEEEEEEESEDEFGRTTTQVISDSYRQKMLEMQRRLIARAITNTGLDLEAAETTPAATKVQQSKAKETDPSKGQTSRVVHFADKLDIQEAPANKLPESDVNEPGNKVNRPIKDEIVERAPVETPVIRSKSKKVSRFKATRGMESDGKNQDTVGSLPEERTPSIHSNIMERPPMEDDIVREPDDLDPQLHAVEVLNTYHRMRNQFIQREDGFMNQDMEAYEDEYGRPQISRFKAAMLVRQLEQEGAHQDL